MSGRSRRLGVTPSFTWRRVAATTSAFMRTTSYRWRNFPALLGGLVQSGPSDLHVSTEPPPVSGSRQPPAWCEGEERVGDDLAERFDVGIICADDDAICSAVCWLVPRGHRRAPKPAWAAWKLEACAPRPMASYMPGRRILMTSP